MENVAAAFYNTKMYCNFESGLVNLKNAFVLFHQVYHCFLFWWWQADFTKYNVFHLNTATITLE